MVFEQTFQSLDIRPGPSSQTVSCWPLSMRVGGEQILSDGASLHSGHPIIQPKREKTMDEIIEKVLRDYAEAWEKLAAL